MADASTAAVDAFVAWVGRANPRFECAPPYMTEHEELLACLDRGDPRARAAFDQAVAAGAPAADVRAQWERRARAEAATQVTRIPLHHALLPPPRALALPSGVDPDFAAFYSCHDSAALFQEHADDEHGLFFLPLAAMAGERESVRDWFFDAEDTDDDVDWDDPATATVYHLPAWFDDCLVFAAYGVSAERYLLATSGPWRGSVLAFCHDEGSLTRVAPSFAAFLDDLRADPLRVVGADLAPTQAVLYASDPAA